jgi:hypothetical protein
MSDIGEASRYGGRARSRAIRVCGGRQGARSCATGRARFKAAFLDSAIRPRRFAGFFQEAKRDASPTIRLRRPAQKHWSAADSYAFVIVYWLLTDGC